MKYFTPDLLARFGSAEEAVADTAHEEWEQRQEAYLEHLAAIRPQLPESVRTVLDQFCLHDARLLTIGTDSAKLSLSLQLDAPRNHGLWLEYQLLDKVKRATHPSLVEGDTPLEWLYDEIDLASSYPAPAFTHSILLTNGWELQLVFRALRVENFQRIIAFPAGLPGEKERTQLEAMLSVPGSFGISH